jgi:hypothetical protein
MPLTQPLPYPFRFALLCVFTLVASRSSLIGCSGDQYWAADPEGTLTWFKRGPEIPVRVRLSQAFDLVQRALQSGGLRLCDSPEKDLIGQKVIVTRAFRTDAGLTRIPAGFVTHQDYSQVMVRIIGRGGNEYVAEILTRTKRGHGRDQPSEVADQLGDCGATAIAEKLRGNLAPLASTR